MRLNKNDYKYEDGAWHTAGIKSWYLSLLLFFHFYSLMSLKPSAFSGLPLLMIIKNWSMLKIHGQFLMAQTRVNYNHSLWRFDTGIRLPSK